MGATLAMAAMLKGGNRALRPAGDRREAAVLHCSPPLEAVDAIFWPLGGGGGGASMASKMGYEAKLVRSFSRIEPQKLGLAVVAGCFAVSLLFIAVLRPPMNPSQIPGLRLTILGSSRTMLVSEDATSSTRLGDVGNNNSTLDNNTDCAASLCQNDKGGSVQEESSIALVPPPPQEPSLNNSLLLDDGRVNSTLDYSLQCDGSLCQDEKGAEEGNSSLVSVFPSRQENVTSSSTHLGDSGSPNKAPADQAEVPCDLKSGLCEVDGDSDVHASFLQADSGNQNKTQEAEAELSCDPKSGLCKIDEDAGSQANSLLKSDDESNTEKKPMQKRKPLCDTSNPRFDICDMAGDVRILGRSSSVLFVDPPTAAPSANETWRFRPYSRKGDNTALVHVREVLVTTSRPGPGGGASFACTVKHDVPAVVFSVSGYTGNFFHDFTDVLIPLFLTTRQFNGQVQFLITDMGYPWWVNKYRLIFNQLTRYEIINFDQEDKVHCYPRAIVGLRSHKELSIDSSKPPEGHSMAEFAKFLRTSFSLAREAVTKLEGRKPRLMIISRKRTRSLVNVRKVVRMARKLGFEVVVGEMGIGSDVAAFAKVVNSCDVLMGVHGAGLTSLLFLPANGTLIQIVPWGGLEGISRLDFGEPAVDSQMRYLEYKIMEEESTLIQQYPRDHPVFKDPFSIHQQGWDALRAVFLDKQNVKLDVKRFRSVLLQVLDRLR